MSHISKFQEDERQQTVLATPNPRILGRSVRDFYFERDVVATPRRFSSVATPLVRRVQYHPDLVAELEEESHRERLNGDFFLILNKLAKPPGTKDKLSHSKCMGSLKADKRTLSVIKRYSHL